MSKSDRAKKRDARRAAKPSPPREIKAAANDDKPSVSVEEIRAGREEARRLKAMPGVRAATDEAGRLVHAVRVNCFGLLLERGTITTAQYDAVMRLEALIHAAMGWDTPERRPDHIRATVAGAPGQNVTQAMIDASREVVRLETQFLPREWRCLTELLEPGSAALSRWRGVVERCVGETTAHGQAGALRRICDRLAWAMNERRAA